MLNLMPRERVPLDWAMTQKNLGLALWRLGLLADAIGELHHHRRTCVDVARHAYRRQTPDHRRGFGEALRDHLDGPVIHGVAGHALESPAA